MMIEKIKCIEGLTEIPASMQETLVAAVAEYEQEGVFFLEEDYIRRVMEKTRAFTRVGEELIAAAARLRADAPAAAYALFACRAAEAHVALVQSGALQGEPVAHPYLLLLALLPGIERTFDLLCKRGIPEDVILASLTQFEDCVFLYEERFGKRGLSPRYFNHMIGYFDGHFLNVGRLRFHLKKNEEIYLLENKNTHERVLFLQDKCINAAGMICGTPPIGDTAELRVALERVGEDYVGYPVWQNGKSARHAVILPAKDYTVLLAPGDEMLGVHIPPLGALSTEVCEASYARVREIFATCYPECAPKAFHCESWMMAPELAEILRPTSNVLGFQKPYYRYPILTEGKDVLNFVFKKREDAVLADLPEDTSLQRALKARYLRGEYLYEYGGVIPFGG